MKRFGSRQQKRYLQKLIDNIAKNDPNTTEVALNGFKIRDESLSALAMSLINNSYVTSLYLHNTGISTKGAHLLAYALQNNSTLSLLSLNDNKVGSSGAEVIAVALYENNTLKTLGLANNSIGNHGGKKISKMLRENRSISEVFLEGNNISPKITAKIDLLCGITPCKDTGRQGDWDDHDGSTYASSDFTSQMSRPLNMIEESEDEEVEEINEFALSLTNSIDLEELHQKSFVDSNPNLASYIRGVTQERKTNTFVESDGDLGAYIKRVTESIEKAEGVVDKTEWANGSDLSIAVDHIQANSKSTRKKVLSRLRSTGLLSRKHV